MDVVHTYITQIAGLVKSLMPLLLERKQLKVIPLSPHPHQEKGLLLINFLFLSFLSNYIYIFCHKLRYILYIYMLC